VVWQLPHSFSEHSVRWGGQHCSFFLFLYWVAPVFVTAMLLARMFLYSWDAGSVELSGCIKDCGGLALGCLVRCGLGVDQVKGSKVSGPAIYIPFYPFPPFQHSILDRRLDLSSDFSYFKPLNFLSSFLYESCEIWFKSRMYSIAVFPKIRSGPHA